MYTSKFHCESYLKLIKCVKSVAKKDVIHAIPMQNVFRYVLHCLQLLVHLPRYVFSSMIFLFYMPAKFALTPTQYVTVLKLLLEFAYRLLGLDTDIPCDGTVLEVSDLDT
jgi:hypothetical protein